MRKKDTKKEKRDDVRLRDRLRATFEVDDLACKKDVLELRGRQHLTVRGCRRILLYSESEIRLLLCEYVLVIKGAELYCASYYAGAVCVDGRISSFEIEEKERGE